MTFGRWLSRREIRKTERIQCTRKNIVEKKENHVSSRLVHCDIMLGNFDSSGTGRLNSETNEEINSREGSAYCSKAPLWDCREIHPFFDTRNVKWTRSSIVSPERKYTPSSRFIYFHSLDKKEENTLKYWDMWLSLTVHNVISWPRSHPYCYINDMKTKSILLVVILYGSTHVPGKWDILKVPKYGIIQYFIYISYMECISVRKAELQLHHIHTSRRFCCIILFQKSTKALI